MKLVKLHQGSPAWLAWRQDGVGGSDAAAVLGESPFEDATRANLLREKVDRVEREANFAMRRGTRMEPAGRAVYEALARCVAMPTCVEHDQAGWMRVSLDGLCRYRAPGPADRPWVLELKAPNEMAHSWALGGEVPPYYRPQCQWQLLVTGLDRLDYASYSRHSRYGPAFARGAEEPTVEESVADALAHPDRFAVVRVEPDPELQARLLTECEKFWLEVLEGRRARAAGLARKDWSKVEAAF